MTKLAEITDCLKELVSFRSVTGSHKEQATLFDYLVFSFADLNMKVKTYSFNGFKSLIVTSKDTKNPKVMLAAHVDVVPADDSSFVMKEEAENLIGRGVFDMKFAAAIYIVLARELARHSDNLNWGIMFTSDEEVGGVDGIGALLNLGYKSDVCILPDGGDNWQLESGCNSAWIAKIYVEGKTAHGSRPWEGKNAIAQLMDCLSEIQARFENKKYKNTLTVSQIGGGNALNQVPDKAWATLDMRFTDEQEYDSLRVEIESNIRKKGIKIETIAHVAGSHLDTDSPHVKSFIELAKQKAPVKVGFSKSLGASDSHYFEANGIPTILMRPRGGGAHSEKEWINKQDLQNYYELIKEFVVTNA